MRQFELAELYGVVCDICGEKMYPVYGGGWDNDRMVCGNKDCDVEVVYPTSTCLGAAGNALDGKKEDVKMTEGMARGLHIEHGQATVFPIGAGEVFKTANVCCDCGLVHLVEIERRNDEVVIRWYRDDDATNKFRDTSASERAERMSSDWVESAFARVVDAPNAAK